MLFVKNLLYLLYSKHKKTIYNYTYLLFRWAARAPPPPPPSSKCFAFFQFYFSFECYSLRGERSTLHPQYQTLLMARERQMFEIRSYILHFTFYCYFNNIEHVNREQCGELLKKKRMQSQYILYTIRMKIWGTYVECFIVLCLCRMVLPGQRTHHMRDNGQCSQLIPPNKPYVICSPTWPTVKA